MLLNVKEMSFITKDGKIDLESLETTFTKLLEDARKSNESDRPLAAARRFRNNTVALGKKFMDMRKATPKMK